MNELALFAGAGGGILGGHLLGWRTICAVEHDPYARDVLVARQNDGCLAPFPVWDDVRTFDGRPWRGRVDVVSGGFPCQDISVAGKGGGIDGARSGLWREMARIIREVAPRFVLVENSPALVGRGLGTVLGDMAALGFDADWGVLGAHHTSAPHKRERIWMLGRNTNRDNVVPLGSVCGGSAATACGVRENVANTESGESWQQTEWERRENTIGGGSDCGGYSEERRDIRHAAADPGGEDVADAGRQHGDGRADQQEPSYRQAAERSEAEHHDQRCGEVGGGGWWLSEPDVGRVAHGVAARVDRLRCLGNGQVPAVVRLAHGILSGR